ncbi:MAG: pyridoxal-phosphate-dependent aminotransferase family protein [Anaerolineae bacterium]|jgi:aspartate aminotransferase-like enzyme|nr:alanine--glyoxylate aminotransferase family protein [Chloroflexota bacterium]
MNLRIPGPTPLPDEVLEAMSRQMIDHRGPDFEALHAEVVAGLRVFFETESDLFVLTSSGTGGMEAAIANTLSPGDRVLVVNLGVFGKRFGTIASRYGVDVTWMDVTMGQAADPAELERRLREQGPFKAVLITQNETSTGVTNPMQALAAVVRAQDPAPLLMVDAISGLGAIRMPQDAWGIDVVVAGSQKAWMAPPGLAFISFSNRAWAAYEQAKCPRFYFDLGGARRYGQRNQTPSTPNLPAFYALQVSLAMMVAEGPEKVQLRHQQIADYCRAGVERVGGRLYAAEGCRSNTVTALTLPEGVDTSTVLRRLREEYGIICATGRDPSVDMVRIGHMGYVTEADLDAVFEGMSTLLKEMM